ncbi:alpha/beta hydrolase fold domain-containing protein [Frankia sp. QA3]|uniref:alpha/beta hydrolase fold domain-containing protein n=1 Tax=Frankia sp. QA3 TaxID=710111 RepID=UPI000269CDA6|nr:alpha/beta hydrolase fold domain-containing protein [Frankia sp. QA3]EIV96577.1 alpha/beta hydrolase fold protein [Frankia sp. QA3]
MLNFVVTYGLVPDAERHGDRIMYRDAVYARIPGFRLLMLDLVVPTAPDPVPVVLYLHGGGFSVGTHKTSWDVLGRQVTEVMVARGIAVASVGYRLSGEMRFPGPLHDVKAAVRWLKHHGAHLGVDPTRVGAWGGSAGGYLTAMLAVTAQHAELEGDVGVTPGDSSIKAGVSWYGPANLAAQPRLGPPTMGNTDPACSPEARLLGAAVDTVPALAAHASPITHATPDSAPLLLVHGTLDDGVPLAQSEDLLAAYRRVNASIKLIRVPDAGHGFKDIDAAPLLRVSAEFLAEELTGT